MRMFDKKKYYTSSLSLKNRYCVKEELHCQSAYERRMQTVDEYNEEYVILFERIGNYLPNGKNFMFELPIHESVVYPVDLIQKSNTYIYENEVGYVYPIAFLKYISWDVFLENCSKEDKVALLYRLCSVIEDLHKKLIFICGFDKKQILIDSGEIKLRYNGFKNHNRNSIYRVPDCIADHYSEIPWVLDVFSLVAIIFECMYEWNPFCGMMTSFSDDEEYLFEIFYNNFRKKIFIFEREKKLNQIGFLIEQRKIIEKWSETDQEICDFFHHILTMDIPEQYSHNVVFEKIHKLIDYYYKSEIFQ